MRRWLRWRVRSKGRRLFVGVRIDTRAEAFPCSVAILEALFRSLPIRSRDRSILCCALAFDSATSSRTLSRIGLTFLNNLDAAASALFGFDPKYPERHTA